MSNRSTWGSRLGFILAAAGSAVGLGAIWKFPYVTAMNGGGVFLLLFLAFSFTLGLAQLSVEFAIGRAGRRGPVGTFKVLAGGAWPLLGLFGVLAAFVLYCFYSVVGGWTIGYIAKALDGSVLSADPAVLKAGFESYVSDPLWPVLTHGAFALATLAVVIGGVEKGIERASKLLMPALFVLMLILIGRALTLPGALAGVATFLTPDWSKLSAAMVVDALGLAFFSLSLGTGGMLAYGSYVKQEAALGRSALWVVALSSSVAILAGFMIFPAVAAFGLDPAAGPGLTFMTMPVVFDHLPFGQGFAIAFFFLLFVAALTSAMNMLELIVTVFLDAFHWPRRPVVIAVSLAVFVCGIPAALSFGAWSDVTVFGKTVFDAMDYSVSNVMMPLSGIGVALFAGWRVWPVIERELSPGPLLRVALLASCRFISPLMVAVILIKNL